jgi:MFS family permease
LLALEHPGFRLYFMGQAVSLTGSWLQAAAVRWLVYEQTHSETMLGIIEVASIMPGLLVGLFAGALADRVAPVSLLVLMECGQMVLAFALAALVGLGVVQIWQMALILAASRICVTFELPSRQVFFYELVGPKILPNAIALNSGLFNATRVIGPALAGFFLSTLGGFGCFVLNGVSFLAAIAAIIAVRLPHRDRPMHAEGFELKEILGGLHYLRSERRILAQFSLVAFFGVAGMGYDAMIAAYAQRVVHTGVEGYSTLLALSGIGATVGALVVASLSSVRRKERITIGGMILFSLSLGGGALFPRLIATDAGTTVRLIVAAGCLLGAGFGAVAFYSSSMMVIQLEIPDRLRGRIMGIWMIVFSGSVPLGAFWTGEAAERWGVAMVMGVSAVLCFVTALAVLASGILVPAPVESPPTGTGPAAA